MPIGLLKPGQNPRDVFPTHRERGSERYEYDRKKVAAARGVSARQLRWDIAAGKVDLADFESVVRYCARIGDNCEK